MKNKNFEKTINHYLDQLVMSQNVGEYCEVLPFHFHIEPTSACNLRCIHCIHSPIDGEKVMTRKAGMMDYDVLKKIIDQAKGYCSSVTFNVQGEPTLHPRILDFVDYAKKAGLFVSLLTNGTRLTEEMSDALIEMDLDRIVFSFDTVNKEIYEKVRVKSKFAPTLKNILTFLKKNYEQGSKTFVCMSMIVEEATKGEKENYSNYFESLPIGTVFFSNLLNMSGYSQVSREIDMDELRSRKEHSQWPICRIPWEDLTINWDGSVVTCPLDFNAKYIVGWVQEKPIKEIWNDEPMKVYRRSLMDRDYEAIEKNGKLCSECNSLFTDPEYDIRNYAGFIKKAIMRRINEYGLENDKQEKNVDLKDPRYLKLLEELKFIQNELLPVSPTA